MAVRKKKPKKVKPKKKGLPKGFIFSLLITLLYFGWSLTKATPEQKSTVDEWMIYSGLLMYIPALFFMIILYPMSRYRPGEKYGEIVRDYKSGDEHSHNVRDESGYSINSSTKKVVESQYYAGTFQRFQKVGAGKYFRRGWILGAALFLAPPLSFFIQKLLFETESSLSALLNMLKDTNILSESLKSYNDLTIVFFITLWILLGIFFRGFKKSDRGTKALQWMLNCGLMVFLFCQWPNIQLIIITLDDFKQQLGF